MRYLTILAALAFLASCSQKSCPGAETYAKSVEEAQKAKEGEAVTWLFKDGEKPVRTVGGVQNDYKSDGAPRKDKRAYSVEYFTKQIFKSGPSKPNPTRFSFSDLFKSSPSKPNPRKLQFNIFKSRPGSKSQPLFRLKIFSSRPSTHRFE